MGTVTAWIRSFGWASVLAAAALVWVQTFVPFVPMALLAPDGETSSWER